MGHDPVMGRRARTVCAVLLGLLRAVLLVLRAHNALDARIAQDNRASTRCSPGSAS